MFYYISGKVAVIEPGMVVIDAGGVGYALNTSYTSARSVKTGEQATFYTYLHVREGIFELYGFARREELSCFKQLIAISGVGPKAAIAILGAVTPEKLALCVISGDEKALTAAPGIGKKLAQRILLEMKDKMSKDQLEAERLERERFEAELEQKLIREQNKVQVLFAIFCVSMALVLSVLLLVYLKRREPIGRRG